MVKERFILGGIIAVMLVALVYSAVTVVNSDGSSTLVISDDTSFILNFSINATNAGLAGNITAVVVILNVSGNYYNLSASPLYANTTALTGLNMSFTNSSTIINWTNNTRYLSNISVGDAKVYYWVNLTAFKPVKYGNISIEIYSNGTVTYLKNTNITVHVNDTFNVDYLASAPADGSNLSQGYLYGAFNISGNETAVSINVTLSNGTGGGSVAFSNYSASNGVYSLANATGYLFNFTNLADGTYYLNVSVNSTSLDKNISLTRTYKIDQTGPVLSLTKSSSTLNTIILVATCTDSVSGVSGGCTTISSTLGVVSGDEISGIACGTTVTVTLNASDYAGNTAQTSTDMATSACSTGGSAGGGSSTTLAWTNTYVIDATQFSSGYSKDLGAKTRVQFKLGTETHSVGVKSISGNSAVIEVASTPQEATMNVGDEKKFDLNADRYYDLSVKLNSIANAKANVSVVKINEAVPEGAEAGETPGAVDETESQPDGVSKSNLAPWIIVLIIVVVVVVALVIIKNKKRK
ncbi:hypothetical protein J4474_01750 [Candidatus Pacearchaeota archaeon]|nr:hypothetical protein [Candidatus Pacearchaeota archaeon]